MRFTEVFKDQIKRWPVEIDVSDGKLKSPDGFISWTLVGIKDSIKKDNSILGDVESFMFWAIFIGFHSQARELFKKDIFKVQVEHLDLNLIEMHFSDHLKQTPELKANYINDLKEK